MEHFTLLPVFSIDVLLGLSNKVLVDFYGTFAVARFKVSVAFIGAVLEAGVAYTGKSIVALKAVVGLLAPGVRHEEDEKGVQKKNSCNERNPPIFCKLGRYSNINDCLAEALQLDLILVAVHQAYVGECP